MILIRTPTGMSDNKSKKKNQSVKQELIPPTKIGDHDT